MIRFTFFFLTFMLTQLLTAQKFNQEVLTNNQQPFLIGKIDVEDLKAKSYASWYGTNYRSYEVDKKTISAIKNELATFKILVFMGTWCGDSKREIPRFIKILETVNFPMKNLKIIAVDRRKDNYKKSPTGEEWGLNIVRVPTIIFYKGGKETNRIIEHPVSTLELDISAIVTGSKYTPNYAQSLHFD